MARASWRMRSARRRPRCCARTSNIETFHLADVVVDRSQRGATHRPVTVPSQQQTPSWRGVLPRQGDEFCLEVLKAKVDSQTFRVLPEQQAYDRQVCRQIGGSDIGRWTGQQETPIRGSPAAGGHCQVRISRRGTVLRNGERLGDRHHLPGQITSRTDADAELRERLPHETAV